MGGVGWHALDKLSETQNRKCGNSIGNILPIFYLEIRNRDSGSRGTQLHYMKNLEDNIWPIVEIFGSRFPLRLALFVSRVGGNVDMDGLGYGLGALRTMGIEGYKVEFSPSSGLPVSQNTELRSPLHIFHAQTSNDSQ